MKIYKYTNRLNEDNILEMVILAPDVKTARKYANIEIEKRGWAKADTGYFIEVKDKKQTVLVSVFKS